MALSSEKMDVVFLWKQNDSGIYGRRADMMLKELANCEWVDRIIEFDAPIDIEVLEKYQEIIADKENTHYDLIIDNAFRGYYGEKYIYGVKAYTYIYSKRGSGRKDFSTMDFYFEWVKKLLKENRIGEKNKILLWNCPINYELSGWLDCLQPSYVVSDIIDDQRAWSSNEKSIQRMTENYIFSTEKSQLVLVNSQEMQKRVLELNSKVEKKLKLIPNGCESFCEKKYDKPELLKNMKGPVIGQVSNLEKKIDIELLEKCAQSHPEWNIVLIGSVHSSDGIEKLKAYSNVYLTGPIPYEEVKSYISNFDVAMIAHRLVDINKAMNPLKLYVYCSLGATVVSTDIPGIDDLKGLIRVAKSHEDFITQIEEALVTPHVYTGQDIAIVNHFSWNKKINDIAGIIEESQKKESDTDSNKLPEAKMIKTWIRRKGKKVVFVIPGIHWVYRKWKKINKKIKNTDTKLQEVKLETGQRITNLRDWTRKKFREADETKLYTERKLLALENQIYALNTKVADIQGELLKCESGEKFSVTIVIDCRGDEIKPCMVRDLLNNTGYEAYSAVLLVEKCDEWKECTGEKVVLKKLTENNYPETVNEIAQKADTDLLVMVSEIQHLSDYWLRELIRSYESQKNCGALGINLHIEELDETRTDAAKHNRMIRNIGSVRFCDTIEKNIYSIVPDYRSSAYGMASSEIVMESIGVWGAAFLVKRQLFLENGGLNPCMEDGYEGIDFSLRLYQKGYHNYIACNVQGLWKRSMKARGYHMFRCRWQSWLAEEMQKEKLEGRQSLFTGQKYKIGIIGDVPEEGTRLAAFVDECLEKRYFVKIIRRNDTGIYEVGPEMDLLISTDELVKKEQLRKQKNELTLMLWLRDAQEFQIKVAQYEQYHIIFREDTGSLYGLTEDSTEVFRDKNVSLLKQVTDLVYRRMETFWEDKSIDILGGMPSGAEKYNWGDYHYALSLQREFEKRGYKAHVKCYPQWFEKSNSRYALVLRGCYEYCPKIEGQTVIMWNISHPADVTPEEYNACDLVYIASERLTKNISEEIKVPVAPLLQCTDETVMGNQKDLGQEYELLFIGNSRGVYRKIIRDLLPTEHKLTVYGRAWDKYIPQEYIAGTYFDNERVGEAYHSAAIVLNDHWDDMRELGLISNRLFDASAANAFVISDEIPEIEEVFDGAVVTYKDREDLKNKVDYYLAHPEERKKKADRGREIVLKYHTFGKRVETMLADLEKYHL